MGCKACESMERIKLEGADMTTDPTLAPVVAAYIRDAAGNYYRIGNATLTLAQTDARYVELTGDTMTGILAFSGQYQGPRFVDEDIRIIPYNGTLHLTDNAWVNYKTLTVREPTVAAEVATKQYVDSGNTAQMGWVSGAVNASGGAWHSNAVTLNLGTVPGVYLVMLEVRAISGATTHDFWTVVTSTSGQNGTAVLPQQSVMGQTKLVTRVGWWIHPGGSQTLYVSAGFSSVASSATVVLQTVRVGSS